MRVNGVSGSAGLVTRPMAPGVAASQRGGASDHPVTPTDSISESRAEQDAPRNPLAAGPGAQATVDPPTHWPAPTLPGLMGHRLLYEVQRQAQLTDGPTAMATADRASDAVIAYRAALDLSTMQLRPDGPGLRHPFRA